MKTIAVQQNEARAVSKYIRMSPSKIRRVLRQIQGKSYKDALVDTFPGLKFRETWADWEGKGTTLSAKTYNHPYLIKSREVDISSDHSSIYNNILWFNSNYITLNKLNYNYKNK